MTLMLSFSLSLSVTFSIRIVFIVVIIIVIIITITVEHANWRSNHLIKADRLMQVSQNTRKQEGRHFYSHSSLIKTWKSKNVNYLICMTIIVITLPIRSTFVSNVLFLSHVTLNWTSIIDTSTLTITKSLLRSAIS